MFDPNYLSRRSFGAMLLLTTAAACAGQEPEVEAPPAETYLPGYEPIEDAGYSLPGIPMKYTQGINRRMEGIYTGEAPLGSIDVDPYAKFLYIVREGADSVRFPIGVGRAGRAFAGNGTIQLKRKWPGWTPTANMLRREPEVYGPFRSGIPGGLSSPLGSRALYL